MPSDNVIPLRAKGPPGPAFQPPDLPPHGGGPIPPDMDGWQQSVEDRLGRLDDRLDSHLKWLLLAFSAGFLVLAGLIIQQTSTLAAKIDGVSRDVSAVQQSVSKVEGARLAEKPAMPPCETGKPDCKPWERAW